MCTLDSDGEIVFSGVVKLDEKALAVQFKHMERARVVFEVGTHSRWLAELFDDWGHEVVVANPRNLALISQNNRKSDVADAELLARLGRSDLKLLRPVVHRSPLAAAGLAVIRSRAALYRDALR